MFDDDERAAAISAEIKARLAAGDEDLRRQLCWALTGGRARWSKYDRVAASTLAMRAARMRAKDDGRCGRCTVLPVAPDRAWCQGCLDYERDRKRAQRAAQRLSVGPLADLREQLEGTP